MGRKPQKSIEELSSQDWLTISELVVYIRERWGRPASKPRIEAMIEKGVLVCDQPEAGMWRLVSRASMDEHYG